MLITLFFNILINIGPTFFQIVEPNIYRQDEDEAWRPPRSVLGEEARQHTRTSVPGCGRVRRHIPVLGMHGCH
jgi:hypothetical protein